MGEALWRMRQRAFLLAREVRLGPRDWS